MVGFLQEPDGEAAPSDATVATGNAQSSGGAVVSQTNADAVAISNEANVPAVATVANAAKAKSGSYANTILRAADDGPASHTSFPNEQNGANAVASLQQRAEQQATYATEDQTFSSVQELRNRKYVALWKT